MRPTPLPPPRRPRGRPTPLTPPPPPPRPRPRHAPAASASINASGASGSFKVDKLQVATDKKIVGEFSLVESFPGTKLTFKATDGSRAAGADAISAVIGAEYKDASGRSVLTVDADAIKAGVDATLLVAYEGVLLGATAKSSLAAGFSVTDYGVLVGYKTKAYTVSAAAEKKMTTVTASYLQVVSPTITTAAIAKFPLAAKVSLEVPSGVRAGGGGGGGFG